MAKKLLRVRSLSCNNLHSDLCMRMQNIFACWWWWQQWQVFIFSFTTIPDHGHGRNAQFFLPFHSETTKFLKLFFFFFVFVAE